MNTGGQISVEMKLMMDSLRRQVKQAAEILKTGLAQGSTSLAPAINKAGQETDKLTAKTKQAANEARNLQKAWLDAIRAGKDVPGQRKINISVDNEPKIRGPAMPPPLPIQLSGQSGLATPPPGSGGGAGAAAAAGGGMFGGINQALLQIGLIGAGLATFRIALGYVKFAFEQLMRPLRAFIAASDQASHLYAKALAGGAGMGYTAASSAFASVLGVSEADVFRYGAAIEYLNKRMGHAIATTARITPNLTSVSWEFKALNYQIQSTFGVLVNEAAPALREFASAATTFVQVLERFVPAIYKLTTRMIENQFPISTRIAKAFLHALGSEGAAAGAPTSSANRLAGSAWERMGFVVGHGSQNHAAETAKNTKRIAALMQTLVSKFTSENNSGRTFAMPNGA